MHKNPYPHFLSLSHTHTHSHTSIAIGGVLLYGQVKEAYSGKAKSAASK